MVEHRPMVRLAWFVLRAAFWLGLASLFVPGLMPREVIQASQLDRIGERMARDTLTPLDREVPWRGPREHRPPARGH
jgi:hypothetical protein